MQKSAFYVIIHKSTTHEDVLPIFLLTVLKSSLSLGIHNESSLVMQAAIDKTKPQNGEIKPITQVVRVPQLEVKVMTSFLGKSLRSLRDVQPPPKVGYPSHIPCEGCRGE